jgi:hypothetical protein
MKKFTSNFLFLLLSSSLTVLINALAASSSTLEFSRLVTTSNDAWLTVSSRLKMDTKGDIYAIDGINNNLQIDEAAKNNNLQEVYVVDGFNNTLQKRGNNERSANLTNEPFVWTKFLTIDKKGNFFRANEISSERSDRIYTIDGINNRLRLSKNEADRQFDGINNLPAYVSVDRGKLPFSSNWLKNIDLGKTGRVYQSKKVTARDNQNIYFQDGFNNEIKEEVSNGKGNVYFANGINNLLQTASPSLFNDGKDEAIAKPDPEFLKLLENFRGNNTPRRTGDRSSNYRKSNYPKNIEKLFANGGNNNPFIGLFDNAEPDPEFLKLLENFTEGGGNPRRNFNFPQGELPENIGNLFTSGENNPWTDAFQNTEVDPEFLSLLEEYVKGGGTFDGDYNFPEGGLPENIGELFADGTNDPFLSLSNQKNNLETAAVPAPSSVLGLLCFGLLFVKNRKYFVAQRNS